MSNITKFVFLITAGENGCESAGNVMACFIENKAPFHEMHAWVWKNGDNVITQMFINLYTLSL